MELFRSLAHQEYALVESNRAQMFEDIARFVNQFGEEGLHCHLVDFPEDGATTQRDVNGLVEAFLDITHRVSLEQTGFRYPDEIEYSLMEEFYERYVESGRDIATRAPHSQVRSFFYIFLFEFC